MLDQLLVLLVCVLNTQKRIVHISILSCLFPPKMHCGNHGSVSKNPVVNNLVGWTVDWIGGNALLWKMQVCHSHTNRAVVYC